MKKLLVAICLFSFMTPFVQAQEKDLVANLKEMARPYIKEYLGDEWELKLVGAPPTRIKMPNIPKVVRDATNTDVYNKRDDDVEPPTKNVMKYNYAFLMETFQVTRNIRPSESEVNKWMNVLSQGATREGIYRGLVLDNTYAGLENYEKPITQATIDFTNFFLRKYLKQSIPSKTLGTVNFFTLKRVAVERTLEVIDELLKNKRADMEDWYAIASSELASKYSHVWKSKLRDDTSAERHQKWAKHVPEQYIKSEIIIKLHKIYNSTI